MKKKIIILLSVVIILLMGIVVWFNIPLDLMDTKTKLQHRALYILIWRVR